MIHCELAAMVQALLVFAIAGFAFCIQTMIWIKAVLKSK